LEPEALVVRFIASRREKEMTMPWCVKTTAGLLVVGLLLTPAWAGLGPLALVSGPSPFAPGCEGTPQPSSTNYLNAEVEPWVDVNPTNPNNIIAVWQQDRWSNGGAHGLLTAATHDGGATWSFTFPHFSTCAGGTAANGGNYDRASDPWVTFSPNGHAYQISLSVNLFDNFATAVLVSKSADGGNTWSEPITLIRDTNPRFFNDKESITADSTDSHFVYAVWDRINTPPGDVTRFFVGNPEHKRDRGFTGPTLFSRTTDGGQTWEEPRIIYNPGANNQTLGNQIVVLPNGTLVNFFSEFLANKGSAGGGKDTVHLSLIRSTDKGATWTHGQPTRAAQMFFQGALDPDTGRAIRAEGVIADVAVNRQNGHLYAVWQDLRFRGVDEIALAISSDGGDTWTAPIRVNQTPASSNPLNQQAFVPAVHVADDGTIGVTYYDFRFNDSNPGAPTDYWIVRCKPVGVTTCASAGDWTQEDRLTTTSFDIEQAPAARGPFGFFVGDYEGLTNIGNDFVPVFVIVNNGNPANRTDVVERTVSP
jgi:hypothetical protein